MGGGGWGGGLMVTLWGKKVNWQQLSTKRNLTNVSDTEYGKRGKYKDWPAICCKFSVLHVSQLHVICANISISICLCWWFSKTNTKKYSWCKILGWSKVLSFALYTIHAFHSHWGQNESTQFKVTGNSFSGHPPIIFKTLENPLPSSQWNQFRPYVNVGLKFEIVVVALQSLINIMVILWGSHGTVFGNGLGNHTIDFLKTSGFSILR